MLRFWFAFLLIILFSVTSAYKIKRSNIDPVLLRVIEVAQNFYDFAQQENGNEIKIERIRSLLNNLHLSVQDALYAFNIAIEHTQDLELKKRLKAYLQRMQKASYELGIGLQGSVVKSMQSLKNAYTKYFELIPESFKITKLLETKAGSEMVTSYLKRAFKLCEFNSYFVYLSTINLNSTRLELQNKIDNTISNISSSLAKINGTDSGVLEELQDHMLIIAYIMDRMTSKIERLSYIYKIRNSGIKIVKYFQDIGKLSYSLRNNDFKSASVDMVKIQIETSLKNSITDLKLLESVIDEKFQKYQETCRDIAIDALVIFSILNDGLHLLIKARETSATNKELPLVS